MNKLRQSFRRKKDLYVPESSRPHQWQTDEEGVRGRKCSFAVKYLGHVEVDESRGMHICEDAVKRLKTVCIIGSSCAVFCTQREMRFIFETHLLMLTCVLSTAEADVKTPAPPSTNTTTAAAVVNPTAPTPTHTSPSSSPPAAGLQDNNPHAIPRRHAPMEALARQGSFRGFPALGQNTSPFKRQLSLRMNELPSTVQRKSDFPITNSVPEVEGEADNISSLCSQITTAFSGHPEDPFSSAPMSKPASSPQSPTAQVNGAASAFPLPVANPVSTAAVAAAAAPPLPARDTNPWAQGPSANPGGKQLTHRRTPSEADRWLEEVSKTVRAQQQPGVPPVGMAMPLPAQPFPINTFMAPTPAAVPMIPSRQQPAFLPPPQGYSLANGIPYGQPSVPVVGITPSQMVANVFGTATHPQVISQPSPANFPKQNSFPQYEVQSNTSPFYKPAQQQLQPPPQPNGTVAFNGAESWSQPSSAQPIDPFEAQWVALESRSRQRTSPSPTNPFSTDLQKTFEIEL
ncbi:UNVERIFIED_CONTAM: hypothetical protein FKN15_065638 [Acipenser sinensis]